jgi:hypothetical protein
MSKKKATVCKIAICYVLGKSKKERFGNFLFGGKRQERVVFDFCGETFM